MVRQFDQEFSRMFAPSLGATKNRGVTPSTLLTGETAYWSLTEFSDGSAPVSRASAVGGHTLTDNNTTPSNAGGIIGNAADLTAASLEYLSVADHADLRGGARDYTFDGWIYLPTPATPGAIINKGSGVSAASIEYYLFTGAGGLTWRLGNGAASVSAIAGTVLANTWTYFCVWYDIADQKCYAQLNNNAPVASATTITTPNELAQPLRFGVAGNLTAYLTGRLNQFGRWNRLLTGTERANRYNAGAGNAHPF